MKKNGQNELNGKEFCTPDLYFASYLHTAGVSMIRTDKENGRIYFVFDATIANIDELKTAWFNNSGKVAALPYANSVKALKSIVHM